MSTRLDVGLIVREWKRIPLLSFVVSVIAFLLFGRGHAGFEAVSVFLFLFLASFIVVTMAWGTALIIRRQRDKFGSVRRTLKAHEKFLESQTGDKEQDVTAFLNEVRKSE